jgi:dipeptidyl aminopeptidase/acylaminoacyl peptidase
MDWKTKKKTNLTQNWDDSVDGGFYWSKDAKTIYFNAAYRGVRQLFSVNPQNAKIAQVTKDKFDVSGIFAETKNGLLVTRTDFNHSPDLFNVSLKNGEFTQITDVNKDNYAAIAPSKSELKMVKTSDGKEMGVWFIYPPNLIQIKNMRHYYIAREVHNLHLPRLSASVGIWLLWQLMII